MDLETLNSFLAGAGGATLLLVLRWVTQKLKNSGNYELSCKYPGCHFVITVSDEKYSYICDELMADHQNRKHPLEFKETY